MSSSKLWLSLVVCVVACGGSSFQSGDAAGGNGGTGATSTGGDATTSGGQVGSSGHTGHAGGTGKAGSSSGGTSAAGDTGLGGDTSVAGTSVSAGGDVSVGGGAEGGGMNGGGIGGTGTTIGGSGGTGGTVDCSDAGMLWQNYLALVDKAKVCDVKVDGQCTANSNIVNQGDCAIPVNSKSEYFDQARKALDAWQSAGCTFKRTMCQAPIGTLSCIPNSNTGVSSTVGTCGYTPIVTQ